MVGAKKNKVICPYCPEMNEVKGSDNGWYVLYKCPDCGAMLRVSKSGEIV